MTRRPTSRHVDCAVVAVLTLLGSGVVDGVRVFVCVGGAGGLDTMLGAALVVGIGGLLCVGGGVTGAVGEAAEVGVVLGSGAADDVQAAASVAAVARTATSRCAGRWRRAGCRLSAVGRTAGCST